MPDRTFDAVIIGAGHNGLTLGCYLARSGFEVAIFERRLEEGGGLCTEELTRPGFLHNVHANYHTFVDLAPAYEDLELYELGLQYVRPEVQMASIFRDGSALTVHTDLDRTCASIARFSSKDADTFRRLYTEAKGYVDLLLRTFMYEPPMSLNELTRALVKFGIEDRSEFLSVRLRRMRIDDFLDRHFESDRVKAHLAFHGAVCSYTNDLPGLGIGFPLLVGKIDNWHVCVGGSHRLAHVLWRDLARHGGIIFPQCAVKKILVEDGRATGVRLADGTEVAARRLVASSVDVEQTLLEMVGREHLGRDFAEKVERCAHKEWTLFTVHLALHEAPRYTAGAFDPEVDRAWVVNLGYASLADLNEHWRLIRRGELPPPLPNAAVNSLYDPTDAPAGKFTGLLRQFAPYELADGGAAAWDGIKGLYAAKCLRVWEEFAPNIAGAVIARAVDTPLDISRKLVNMIRGDWMMGEVSQDNLLDRRPFPELAQYRTPIAGLYMCGSTQHPHGFITFAPAYNALQVIADDLRLERWWRRV